jgi:hypothetical protein
MLPESILQIIRLSLEITLEVIKGIPDAQKAAMWERHEKRIEFWEKLFQGLQPKP